MTKMKNKSSGSKDYTEAFLKSNKDYHYNLEEGAEPYLVSSGSLILDHILSGGFGSGLHRFIGANEGGKTNEALHVMHNMLKTVENSKGLFVMAEGRLSQDVKHRAGIKFVHSAENWDVGTCLVLECHIMDTMIDFLRGLLKNNPDKEKFCIVIDSMDGLITKEDLEKGSSDARKVAGGALMTSDFLKRVSLGMSKFGHMCIMISQVRSTITTSMYAKQDPNNQTNSSGGNAILHYPDWILEFKKQNKSDKILEKPTEQITPDNKIYGHNAKVLILKSTNEATGQIVTYPIKHGRSDGKSIWLEREVVDMLLMWGYLEKSGAWIKVDEKIKTLLQENQIEFKDSYQGIKSVYEFLESDDKITALLVDFIKENILKQ
jgi:recombination protein RecA